MYGTENNHLMKLNYIKLNHVTVYYIVPILHHITFYEIMLDHFLSDSIILDHNKSKHCHNLLSFGISN